MIILAQTNQSGTSIICVSEDLVLRVPEKFPASNTPKNPMLSIRTCIVRRSTPTDFLGKRDDVLANLSSTLQFPLVLAVWLQQRL